MCVLYIRIGCIKIINGRWMSMKGYFRALLVLNVQLVAKLLRVIR